MLMARDRGYVKTADLLQVSGPLGTTADTNYMQSLTLFLSVPGCLRNPVLMISSVARSILNSWLGMPQSLRKQIPLTRGLSFLASKVSSSSFTSPSSYLSLPKGVGCLISLAPNYVGEWQQWLQIDTTRRTEAKAKMGPWKKTLSSLDISLNIVPTRLAKIITCKNFNVDKIFSSYSSVM